MFRFFRRAARSTRAADVFHSLRRVCRGARVSRGLPPLAVGCCLGGAAIASLRMAAPARAGATSLAAMMASRLHAGATINAFGASGEVRMRFALPGDSVEFPIEISGDDPRSLSYAWLPADDTTRIVTPTPLHGEFVAPPVPGVYRLALVRGAERDVIPEPTLAVMVPFARKIGAMLNGYRIGKYRAERASGRHPAGFVEVTPANAELPVSAHLTLGDFITHDRQADVWPKYVALNPRLLDKIELVLATLGARARWTAGDSTLDVAFDVHSGFRTPAHNRLVPHAARDSQHQYGDAADLAIDANGDGRVTREDDLLVARAVDQVEAEHPDLVGGLGLYVSRRYRTPYVHIDTRGKRTRWTG